MAKEEEEEDMNEMNLICAILGHRWEYLNDEISRCVRCAEVRTDFINKEPVSELDKIIHDQDWYSPHKKEVRKDGRKEKMDSKSS